MPDTPDEELVRRLLADARHDEPMPPDVAARLDGVLDDLRAEGDRAAAPAPLRPRRDVRRRGRWAVGLAAAAAVVVGGVAVRSLGPVDDGSSAGSSASDSGSGADSAGGRTADPGSVPALHRDTLAADVRRATVRLRRGSLAPPLTGASGCAAADAAPGAAYPATLDGEEVVLVLRPPAGGRQEADVLACGTAEVLASVTVPAR